MKGIVRIMKLPSLEVGRTTPGSEDPRRRSPARRTRQPEPTDAVHLVFDGSPGRPAGDVGHRRGQHKVRTGRGSVPPPQALRTGGAIEASTWPRRVDILRSAARRMRTSHSK